MEKSTEEWAEKKKDSYKIFNNIAGTYDLLNRILSFGIDIYWRKKMMKLIPERDFRGYTCLDLACGTGDLTIELARNSCIKRVTGMDLSEGMINIGRQKISQHKLQHKATMTIGNGVSIPAADHSFELCTISFGIRNFSHPEKSLSDIYRILKNHGVLMIMELSLPKNIFVRSFYLFYFRNILPFVGKIISQDPEAYCYLNQTVEDFPYGEKFLKLISTAGFKNVRKHELTFGIATLYIGEKKE